MNETQFYLLRLQPDTGVPFYSERTCIIIGRSLEMCDLSFPESQGISRVHAAVFYRDGNWYVEDKGSRNGTWLNKVKLPPFQEHILRPGDCIDLAHTHCVVFAEGKQPTKPSVTPTFIPEIPKPRPAVPTFCPNCGASVVSDRLFCTMCGSRVDGATMPKPAPPPILAVPSPAPDMTPPPMPSMAPAPAPRMAPPPMPSMAPAPAPSMAPTPQKKQGLFSKLFGGKSQSAPQASHPAPAPAFTPPAPPAPPAPVTADDVQFRSTAPQRLNPGEYFPVKIMMYREDDYERADRESAMVADKVKSASSSVFQATRGQRFRIVLQSPDIDVDCESQELHWNGKFATADFEVFLPEDFDKKQLRLRGRIYSGDAVLTDLKLILQVDAPGAQTTVCEKARLRSAFISYASADRAKVVARIQGIQLACPDMDLFFDVESLRRGESWESRLYQEIAGRDLFYLFWSQNAAASEWVKKELQYAVSQKTLDFIEPIPLESPDICTPPDSLMGKHFNDWTLRYLNNM